jgi:acyl dehydratase
MPTIFATPEALLGAVGRKLGASEWLAIDQARVNQFADATGDHQWIHVDPERAKSGPFGATIAHGYLTLSLVNSFLPQLLEVRGTSMGVNYGCDRVRFPSPVRVGSRVRGVGEVVAAEALKGGAVQVIVRVTVEIEGSDRPACVVDTISRFLPA